MRLLAINCIILACVATALAEDTTRPKRHLLEWKDLLLAKLFGVKPNHNKPALMTPVLVKQAGDVRIYRMPGYDDILVKAVPRAVAKPVVVEEATAPEDPNIAIIQSYLGTETPEDTVKALEGIRNLLKSGIILRPRPIPIPPAPRIQPFRVVPSSYFAPEPVKKMEEVPSLPSHYPYKRYSNPGATSYSSHKNGEVMVTETTDTLHLPPPYVMERFQNIWRELPVTSKVIGPLTPLPPPPQVIVPTRFFPPEPVKKMKVLPNLPSHYSYKQFSNPGVTSYSSHDNGEVVVTETTDTLPLPPPYVMERFKNIWRELPVLSKVIRPLKPLPPPPEIKGILIQQRPAAYQSSPVVRPVVKLPEEIIEVPSYRPAPLPVGPEPYRLPELYVNHDCKNKRKGTNEPHVSCFEIAPEKPVSNTQDMKLSYYNQDSNKWHGATHWSSAPANIPRSYSYSQFYKDDSFMTHRKDLGDAVNVMKSDNLHPVKYFSESNRNQDALPPPPQVIVPTRFFPPEPVKKMEVLPNLPSHYSYKQFSNPGVTSYSSHNNREAVVTETKDTLRLPPPYVMERFQNIWRELPVTSKVIGPLTPLPPPPQVIVPTRFFPPEPVKKMKVLPNLPSHYSYKQFSNPGVTSYSSHDNGEVVVTETTDTLPSPPPYVMERFKNIWRELPVLSKVIRPLKPLPPPPEIKDILIQQPAAYQSSPVVRPVVKLPEEIIEVPTYRPAPLPVGPEPYRLPELYVNHDCKNKRKGTNEPHVSCFEVSPEKPVSNTQDVKLSYYNQDSNKWHGATHWSSAPANIPRSYSYSQFYKDDSFMTHRKDLGDAVNVIKSDNLHPVKYFSESNRNQDALTLTSSVEPIPVQPLTITKEEISREDENSKVQYSRREETKTNLDSSKSGAVYFKKPIPSSYMFKLVNHKDQTRPFTIVRVGDTIQTENIPSVSIDSNQFNQIPAASNEELSKQYVYIPPEIPLGSVIGTEPLKDQQNSVPKVNIPSYYSYKQKSNAGTMEYRRNRNAELKEETTATSKPEETVSPSTTNSWMSSPISVPDPHYYYQHSKLDGSKITISGNSKAGVTIETDVKSDKNSRGDLPDASF